MWPGSRTPMFLMSLQDEANNTSARLKTILPIWSFFFPLYYYFYLLFIYLFVPPFFLFFIIIIMIIIYFYFIFHILQAGSQVEAGQAAARHLCHVCHSLVPQGEHLVHAGDPGPGEALSVLAHLDGVQPLSHRAEHGAVTTTGAGQADGDAEEEEEEEEVNHLPLLHYGHSPQTLLMKRSSLS